MRKMQSTGLVDEIRKRRFFEKGATQRVRQQKEAIMKRVNRDFRSQLEWCLKQRRRCVYGDVFAVVVTSWWWLTQVQVMVTAARSACL